MCRVGNNSSGLSAQHRVRPKTRKASFDGMFEEFMVELSGMTRSSIALFDLGSRSVQTPVGSSFTRLDVYRPRQHKLYQVPKAAFDSLAGICICFGAT